jgi:hypothetical protein
MIWCGDRIPEAEARATPRIGLEKRGIGPRRFPGEPAEQRGAGIPAHPFERVEDLPNSPLRVQHPRFGNRPIAFSQDAFVPVSERRRGSLDRNAICPGILAGRLIEVAMEDDRRSLHRPAPPARSFLRARALSYTSR